MRRERAWSISESVVRVGMLFVAGIMVGRVIGFGCALAHAEVASLLSAADGWRSNWVLDVRWRIRRMLHY